MLELALWVFAHKPFDPIGALALAVVIIGFYIYGKS
jgi:hypothetical protein